MSISDGNISEPVHLVEDDATGDRFLIYGTERGVKVELRYEGGTLWMTQEQMAAVFALDRSGIAKHLKNIFAEGELEEAAVCAKNARTAADGKSYPTQFYNLDAIISVGYRVSSKQGTLFRKWATGVLVQFATRGFVVDVDRLKNPVEYDRVAELREIIRDIRSSEANLYAELRRICAMCQDYDPQNDSSREFYQHMQAKLFWAVATKTPSMIISERANAAAPNMGLCTWPKTEIRQQDALVAKNYLTQGEIKELNRLTDILVSIFEDQLDIGKLTLMTEASALLDQQLRNLNRSVLRHGGTVKHSTAERAAKAAYAKFDKQRRELRRIEADKQLAELKGVANAMPKKKRRTTKPD